MLHYNDWGIKTIAVFDENKKIKNLYFLDEKGKLLHKRKRQEKRCTWVLINGMITYKIDPDAEAYNLWNTGRDLWNLFKASVEMS
ncbi:hypothetical protein TRFO_35140 [Tritrichomonas foetus]|uniref:Uncharacterized protein n=1 Tax=Tritrichomonas foetus TaxID=1144522 RepID=A0A1J4JH14_9EUKA|nr:hypothetical protein TRFO_35140 [Tritrichomonas foetus]|eukprot:OHS98438.1 hypothetical protein TRFO_35140 [Tritrichomonas foetus]